MAAAQPPIPVSMHVTTILLLLPIQLSDGNSSKRGTPGSPALYRDYVGITGILIRVYLGSRDYVGITGILIRVDLGSIWRHFAPSPYAFEELQAKAVLVDNGHMPLCSGCRLVANCL